jgi:hypothetical protein
MRRKALACLGMLATTCSMAAVVGSGSISAPALAAASAASSPAISTPYYSPNWGGYLAVAPAGQQIDYVYASTTVPKVNCKNSVGQAPYYAAEWVGMDGYGNLAPGPHNGLEQAGILEYCAKKGSTPEYYAFWEMVPGPIHLFGMVNPGDTVDMSVAGPNVELDGQFTLTVNDETQPVSQGAHQIGASPPTGTIGYRHTAEVVTERLMLNGQLSGLLNTGQVTYIQANYILSSGTQFAVTQHPVWNLRIMPSLPSSSGLWPVTNDDFSTSIGTWQFYLA